MREIRKSGSMSGEGKRSDARRHKPPRPSSTLLLCPVKNYCTILVARTRVTPAGRPCVNSPRARSRSSGRRAGRAARILLTVALGAHSAAARLPRAPPPGGRDRPLRARDEPIRRGNLAPPRWPSSPMPLARRISRHEGGKDAGEQQPDVCPDRAGSAAPPCRRAASPRRTRRSSHISGPATPRRRAGWG